MIGLWMMLLSGFLLLGGPARAADATFSDQEVASALPYDLGPATVDVSHYPPNQQANYALFQKKCSLCHTSARALNFPLVDEAEWRRFIMRMHARAQANLIDEDDAMRIASFLAYDGAERKLKDPESFARLQGLLDKRYADLQKERQRRLASCK